MAVLVVLLYGFSHIPCIIIQRYNRPRLCALLRRCQRKGGRNDMKVLILTCNTGGGHNAAAAALRRELESRGHTCAVADALSFWAQAFFGGDQPSAHHCLPVFSQNIRGGLPQKKKSGCWGRMRPPLNTR